MVRTSDRATTSSGTATVVVTPESPGSSSSRQTSRKKLGLKNSSKHDKSNAHAAAEQALAEGPSTPPVRLRLHHVPAQPAPSSAKKKAKSPRSREPPATPAHSAAFSHELLSHPAARATHVPPGGDTRRHHVPTNLPSPWPPTRAGQHPQPSAADEWAPAMPLPARMEWTRNVPGLEDLCFFDTTGPDGRPLCMPIPREASFDLIPELRGPAPRRPSGHSHPGQPAHGPPTRRMSRSPSATSVSSASPVATATGFGPSPSTVPTAGSSPSASQQSVNRLATAPVSACPSMDLSRGSPSGSLTRRLFGRPFGRKTGRRQYQDPGAFAFDPAVTLNLTPSPSQGSVSGGHAAPSPSGAGQQPPTPTVAEAGVRVIEASQLDPAVLSQLAAVASPTSGPAGERVVDLTNATPEQIEDFFRQAAESSLGSASAGAESAGETVAPDVAFADLAAGPSTRSSRWRLSKKWRSRAKRVLGAIAITGGVLVVVGGVVAMTVLFPPGLFLLLPIVAAVGVTGADAITNARGSELAGEHDDSIRADSDPVGRALAEDFAAADFQAEGALDRPAVFASPVSGSASQRPSVDDHHEGEYVVDEPMPVAVASSDPIPGAIPAYPPPSYDEIFS
ncbi:hypothetical protein H696_00926 [Fonticula alba]|uniref:Uncharacterized protein n=1 Tax=Fonticula alba TaxID=691883 RepID=A0A058ZIP2_FONAL|nr:hypothetical protein H696_00926 [Fonticula alba]KCV73387.1 hypothetical protein H696_00926 [Fonticula alba]|eukprot:XP_009493088.1 hypothetical protein H696_00926 [Fonticula alba]